MELDYWASTDVGRVRERNEDNYLVDPSLQLFVVCDGMGGHAAGDVASSICVKVVREVVLDNVEVLEAFDKNPKSTELYQEVFNVLKEAIKKANDKILDVATHDAKKKGMGTTCSVLLLRQNHAFMAHVGDSRIYLCRDSSIVQMTDDHSLAAEMIRSGKLDPRDAHSVGWGNALTRAVGVMQDLNIATYHLDTVPEDTFLMCSDGLSTYLDFQHRPLHSVFGAPDLETATHIAIDYAKRKGGADNITCVMVKVFDGAEKTTPALDTIRIALRCTPFLKDCTDQELNSIVEVARRYEIPKQALVKQWNFKDNQLFIVLQGEITVNSFSTKRRNTLRRKLVSGNCFGAPVLFGVQDSKIEVQTHDNTVLLGLSTSSLEELSKKLPELGVKILWPLANYAVKICHEEASFGDESATERRGNQRRRRRSSSDEFEAVPGPTRMLPETTLEKLTSLITEELGKAEKDDKESSESESDSNEAVDQDQVSEENSLTEKSNDDPTIKRPYELPPSAEVDDPSKLHVDFDRRS